MLASLKGDHDATFISFLSLLSKHMYHLRQAPSPKSCLHVLCTFTVALCLSLIFLPQNGATANAAVPGLLQPRGQAANTLRAKHQNCKAELGYTFCQGQLK